VIILKAKRNKRLFRKSVRSVETAMDPFESKAVLLTSAAPWWPSRPDSAGPFSPSSGANSCGSGEAASSPASPSETASSTVCRTAWARTVASLGGNASPRW
jgi:hypothetical protein